MLEVKMTDYSSSFIVQKWGRKPEEQAMFDMVKKGMWIKVKGSVQMDQYKHELVLSARDMVEIKAKNTGMTTLFEHGCMAVEKGQTTFEELIRVLGLPNGS